MRSFLFDIDSILSRILLFSVRTLIVFATLISFFFCYFKVFFLFIRFDQLVAIDAKDIRKKKIFTEKTVKKKCIKYENQIENETSMRMEMEREKRKKE